jgi:hypothetical protein
MGDLDPRTLKVRRIGVGVFLTLTVACVPIGIHLMQTREKPELWLTLLGAVLMLVLISLYALETAIAPIPEPMYESTDNEVDPEAKTVMDEPEDAEDNEPGLATLVEAVEDPTHPPFDLTKPLAEQATRINEPEATNEITENPDAPLLIVAAQMLETEPDTVQPPLGTPEELAETESNEEES